MKEKPNTLTEAVKIGFEEGMTFNAECKKRQTKIAKRVKQLRTEKGYTQQQVAEIIEVNRLTYANYEQCKAEFRIEVLCRLASLFGVSMDYICCMTDNPNGRDVTNDPERQKIINRLEKQVEELNEQIKALK